MSKNEENNSQIVLNNNITQNLKQYFHHKNNSSNITPDSPSNLMSMKLHSLNSNKNDQKKLIPNNNNNNHSINNKINTNNINNSLQDMNNIRIKLSKISSQFSANTPKQLANIYNQLCGVRVDPSNIVVKKNLNLEMKNLKKSMKNSGNKGERNTKINNDIVKYVNNDKFHFNGNFLNMKNNCSKIILSQSKSFINKNKNKNENDINPGINTPSNKSFNNINVKKKIENKKLGLTMLNKSSNNIYRNYYSKNLKDNCVMNTSNSQNEYFHNNDNTNKIIKSNNLSKGNKKFSEDSSDNINKKIYLMKPVYKRKKSVNNNKSIENSNINTNQSSICSRNKNFYDDNIVNDFLNNNIENPEELHFFYVKILQKTNEISKKFEID